MSGCPVWMIKLTARHELDQRSWPTPERSEIIGGTTPEWTEERKFRRKERGEELRDAGRIHTGV